VLLPPPLLLLLLLQAAQREEEEEEDAAPRPGLPLFGSISSRKVSGIVFCLC
jgi:hypothetical protein